MSDALRNATDRTPNLAVITLRQILYQGLPVCLVTHDEDDGGWQFLTLGSFTAADGIVVGLSEMLSHDSSLVELMDLEKGWKATRTGINAQWNRQLNRSS